MILFTVSIPGKVAILKNQKKLIRIHGRMIPVSSDRYKAWESVAMAYVRTAWRGKPCITCPLVFVATAHFANRKNEPDLSNTLEGPADVLQKAGVIFDDKQIKKIIAEKFIDGSEFFTIELREYVAEAN